MIEPVASPATLFFGNPPQVRSLRQHVLPELLGRVAEDVRRLQVWSVDCDRGEEPYTVAMLVDEALRDPYGWDVRVLGTDASSDAVRSGQRARYALRSLVMTDPADVRRWFRRDGEHFVVARDVRSRVLLRHCDLATEPPPLATGEVDLLLWRQPPVEDLARISQVLDTISVGGYAILGPAAVRLVEPGDYPALLAGDELVSLGDSWIYRRTESHERRATLPERRTASEGAPPLGLGRERRSGPRRVLVSHNAARQAVDASAPDREIDLTDGRIGGPVSAPSEAAQLLRSARACLVDGDFLAAAADAERASARCPADAFGWYLWGVALVNAGRDEEAAQRLQAAARCDPGDGVTQYVLARALVRLGRSMEAGQAYGAAAALLGRPGDEVAPELGGQTLGELIRLCRRFADELTGEEQPGSSEPGSGPRRRRGDQT